MKQKEVVAAFNILKAINNRTRFGIIRQLEKGDVPRSVLMEAFGLPGNKMDYHLGQLARIRLIQKKRLPVKAAQSERLYLHWSLDWEAMQAIEEAIEKLVRA